MTALNQDHFDIIIVGGGMAGATMAIALAPLHLNIALIEAYPYQAQGQPSFDDRCLALAWSSKQIYQSMGIWDDLAQREDGFSAIKDIHISDRGHIGVTRLNHEKEGVPALGYVVESRVMGEVLLNKIKQYEHIQLFCPATIEQLDTYPDVVKVTLSVDQKKIKINADLLIIADGVNSKTRDLLGIQTHQKSYGQTAIIANIETEIPHNNRAFERFTDSGPLALLPLTRHRCSLVWTARDDQRDHLMALNEADFCQALQQRFGYRLGKIQKVGHRVAYPLVSMTINNDTLADQSRIALIGNAAHGVHPVAGQGFNLGLRDISALAELIATEIKGHKQGDSGHQSLLDAYWQWRQADIKQVSRITEGLITLFSNQSIPLALLRNSGLLMADSLPPLKHAIAHEAMGNGLLQGKLTKMAVGQSLY